MSKAESWRIEVRISLRYGEHTELPGKKCAPAIGNVPFEFVDDASQEWFFKFELRRRNKKPQVGRISEPAAKGAPLTDALREWLLAQAAPLLRYAVGINMDKKK